MLRLLVARVEFQEGAHARIITRVNFQAWQPPCWPIVHGMVKISRITHRGWLYLRMRISRELVSLANRNWVTLYIYIDTYVWTTDYFFPTTIFAFCFFFITREIVGIVIIDAFVFSCNCMHFVILIVFNITKRNVYVCVCVILYYYEFKILGL